MDGRLISRSSLGILGAVAGRSTIKKGITIMDIKDCFAGQRVLYKENGKAATVKEVLLHKNTVQLVFDNSAQQTVHPRFLQPLSTREGEVEDVSSSSGGITNPCPACAAPMPVGSTQCGACGFAYRKKGSALGGVVKFVVVLAVLAGIGYAVWKYVLHEKLPF
jgi:hypothetical protein